MQFLNTFWFWVGRQRVERRLLPKCRRRHCPASNFLDWWQSPRSRHVYKLKYHRKSRILLIIQSDIKMSWAHCVLLLTPRESVKSPRMTFSIAGRFLFIFYFSSRWVGFSEIFQSPRCTETFVVELNGQTLFYLSYIFVSEQMDLNWCNLTIVVPILRGCQTNQ